MLSPEVDRPSLSRQSSSGQSTSNLPTMAPVTPEFSTTNIPPVKFDDKERPYHGLQILKAVSESAALRPFMRDLLSAK